MKLVVFGVIVVVIVGTYVALARTWLGRAAFAYAQNPEAAQLMGVHTPRLETAVMLYSTGLAGLGGALYASLYSLEPAMGGVYVLKGMEAAILGGIGSLMGSLWGGVILGIIEGWIHFLPTAFRDAYGLAVSSRSFSFGRRDCSEANETRDHRVRAARRVAVAVRSDFVLTIFIFTFIYGILAGRST